MARAFGTALFQPLIVAFARAVIPNFQGKTKIFESPLKHLKIRFQPLPDAADQAAAGAADRGQTWPRCRAAMF